MTRAGVAIAPLAAGAAAATFVVLDAPLAARFGWGGPPYAASGVVALALLLATAGWTLARRHAAVAARTPWHLALVLPIVAASLSGLRLGRIDVLDVTIAVMAVAWVVTRLSDPHKPVQATPLLLVVLALAFSTGLAFARSPSLSGVVTLGEKLVLFLLVVGAMRAPTALPRAAAVLVATGVVAALIAIAQFLLFMIWGIFWAVNAPEQMPESFLKLTPVGPMVRATGLFQSSGQLNDFLLVAIGLAAFGAVRTETHPGSRLYGLATVLLAIGVVLTWSTASLALLVGLALLFPFVRRPDLAIPYGTLLLLAAAIGLQTGLLDAVVGFFASYAEASGATRVELLALGMEWLRAHPLVGIGVWNFANVTGNFFVEGSYLIGYPVHNAFLQMATELGPLAGLLFVGMVIWLSLRLLTLLRALPSAQRWIAKGLLLGWVSVVIHMFSEPVAYDGFVWLLFGIVEGAAVWALSLRASDPGPASLALVKPVA